jgi:hypothetical protein
VTGKIVVVIGGEPDGDLFNGPYATNYQSAAYKADEAKRRGALGVITLVKAAAGEPGWTRMAQAGNRTRTLTPGAADTEFSGSVNADTAKAMGLDIETLSARAASGDFRAFAVPDVKLSLEVAETIVDQVKAM